MVSFKVVFVPRARDDLRSIVQFIARRNSSEIAERIGMDLITKALSLSTFPERGRIVPELKNPQVREIFYKTYRIVFRIQGQTVEVIRFWHAARGTPEIDSDQFTKS